MAALLHAHPFVPPARSAPARPVPARRQRPGRPRLVVVHGGRTTTVPLAIPVVLALVALGLGTIVVALRVAQGAPPATTWQELSAASMADPAPMAAPGDRVITVHPGDTLWGIATRLAPGQDPRPLVAALTRANGGTLLQTGQTLVVPAGLLGGDAASER
jgi:hypothetical protein